MLPEQIKRLAKKIAKDLFVAGNGVRAETLKLYTKDGKYLGGWCEMAVAYVIEKHVSKAARGPKGVGK